MISIDRQITFTPKGILRNSNGILIAFSKTVVYDDRGNAHEQGTALVEEELTKKLLTLDLRNYEITFIN